MKKRNLQLLVLSLFLVLAQNSLAVKLEQGTGNEAASEESVAIGLSYTDTNGVEHKNIAGNPTKANEKYYATAIGIANTANEKWSSAFGYGNTASGLKASAFGYNNKASARENSAFGYNNTASKDGASAFGYRNTASARKSSAFGYENTVSGTDSSAFGYRNTASSDRASAFGYRNTASARESLAFGYQNIASAMKSSAFGYNNTASELFSSAFGYNNIASKISSSAFGYENTASGEKASAFGYNNTASGERASTFGNANTVGKLKDDGSGKKVPDENYGKNSLIFGTKYQVTGNSSGAFGIGKANWNGTTKQYDYDYVNEGNNSYMIGNLNKIASGSDDNFILGNNVEIGAGITKSVVLGDGSTSGGSNTVSVGSASLQRKIVNVGDGTISATSTDAVTGKQLYKAMQNSGALGIENLRNEVYEKIDDVKSEVRGIGSLSAALAGLHPMQYDPKAPAQVMAALGHYKNRQAVAVGASYHFNDRFMMSTGIALSGERKTKTMANIGFTLKLGKGSGVTYNETPQYVVQNEVKRLTVENNKQAKKNQELKAEVNSLITKTREQDEKIKNLEEKLNMLLKNK